MSDCFALNTNYSSLSHVWASFASNRPTLGASCVGSVGRQSQLLAPRCASFASTRPTVCANCVGSPQVRRKFQLLGPRLASFASTRPTLGANCVRSPHVRRQLCHLAPRQAPIAAVYMCVPIFGFRGLDLYTRFGFCSGLQNKKLDSTYTRGRLIHEDIR